MLEIVNKIFDNYESWAAFIDLKNKEFEILNVWSAEFKKKLSAIFYKSYPNWRIEFVGTKDLFIYPKVRESRASIELWFEHKEKFIFSLWADSDIFNLSKIYKIIKDKLIIFEQLISDQIILTNDNKNEYIFKYELNYNLSKCIGYNADLLNYFIKDELPEEINKFVQPILANIEIYDLIEMMNKTCKLK
jgi:hypothetical protein